MENFTNETIDTAKLPKYEEVVLTALHPNYKKVVLLNVCIFSITVFVVFCVLMFVNQERLAELNVLLVGSILALLIILLSFFSLLSYRKKAFAFRNHDVIFKSGIISTNTMVIPYNRIQHVALHEGLVSRYFGLAKVEIFTAGGHSSDLEIPGIEKSQAEDIKQLLMGKIQKQL